MSNKCKEAESPVVFLKDETARQRWELFHRAIAHAKQSNVASLDEDRDSGDAQIGESTTPKNSSAVVERIAQLLDDLDDLVSMFGLVAERIRRFLVTFVAAFTGTSIIAGGIVLALLHPPLALAVALLLFVSLLYRVVTAPRLEMI